ncbi:MAG: hypothetical protein JWN04_2702, partial [Myxococcaceae bacterium]|nr:hypothetical protein [Myxococcaceae bacterium]
MLAIAAPHGATIKIPSSPSEDAVRYPSAGDLVGLREYYDENGYVVVRGALPALACDAVRRAFD